MTREHVLLTAFVALESAHFYSAFLPSVMTIRKFAHDQTAREALRQGEVLATTFAVTLGWLVSELTQTSWPVWGSVIVAAAMVLVYESAMRQTTDEVLA